MLRKSLSWSLTRDTTKIRIRHHHVLGILVLKILNNGAADGIAQADPVWSHFNVFNTSST